MKLSITIMLAFKNLWQHRMRTILTVIGVIIGIGSIIFLVSLGYGLEQLVTNQVANFNAFTIIDVPATNIKTISIDQSAIDRINDLGHIKKAAPVANLAGRIQKSEESSTAETVIVAGGPDYWQLSDILTTQGTMPKNKDEIVINKSVLSLIGETEQQIINKDVSIDMLITPELQAKSEEGLKTVTDIKLKVVGVIDDSKEPIVYISLDQLAANNAPKFSSLKIKVDSRDNVPQIRQQLENMGLSTEYVGDTVSEISRVFVFFRAILAAFGLIALIVAALGTFNTLTISLLERVKEVGLLKALGMKNKDVYKLFLVESLIIGITGGVIGLIDGVGLGQIINLILTQLAHQSGAESIKVFITPVNFSLGIALFSVFVGFLTGWYPAKRAVKINALDALRYE